MVSDEKLGLDTRFERWVVFYMVTSEKFFSRAGHAIDSDSLSNEAAVWLARACTHIYNDTGRGPGTSVIVLQRLRRWVGEGRLKQSVIEDALDILEAAEDDSNPIAEEAVINEITPVLRRRKQQHALQVALSEFGQHGDLKKAIRLIEQANQIGISTQSAGIKLEADALSKISALRHLDKLATGIDELDYFLDGGLPRGSLGVVVGGSGDGKSMCLSQTAATAASQGCCTLYATLELPEAVVLARMTSSLTQVPLHKILAGSPIAEERLKRLASKLGPTRIKEFTAKATTSQDILAWVDEVARTEGRQVDCLVVDYADKLSATGERSEYQEMGKVYEALRVGCHERGLWGWTASQATRKKGGTKRLDQDDVADSMHKVRVADLVITLTVNETPEAEREVEIFVAKNRHGASRRSLGPFKTDFIFGRLTNSAQLINFSTAELK